ncbi:hypothetical protein EG346_11040 [Chryseobacterium carnipullorum]|uniref:Uncharacterized protein n=1 Tax=Chryseobacterium carnipullorum TaxID=1124835 RepID=A0A1M7NTY0_CHRCU|nr:hypothetical protein [Chryseobacterium carnipullorum]AZA48684.1 hypothetical protein EG346_11040 [Chryseobacterium carnipullorum]AZA63598.1 hypothetical protein EG345_01940 [Chryseobacterium carnipullorum]SHN07492.1 hypothetical protein SAMN05444360_1383 [Chryseobacterium carnipullorum]STC92914.1 Uncharacterised protein [Chryseobacterium carnipullorum]
MKNLKKISRENLKAVKGGITQECAVWWGSGKPYYKTEAACIQAALNNQDDFPNCHNECGRWYGY